jgi:hypothetical protein
VPNSGTITSISSVNDGNWHYVAWVFDRYVGSYLYIDGVVDATEETSEWTDIGSLSGIGNFEIGGYNENNYFTGYVAGARVSDYALTAEEVFRNYNNARDWPFGSYFTLGKDRFTQGMTTTVTTYVPHSFTWEDRALYECSFKAKGYSDNTDNVDVGMYTENDSILYYIDAGTDESWTTYGTYHKGDSADTQFRITLGSNAHVAVDDVRIKKFDTAEITTYVEDFSPNLYSGLMMSGLELDQIAHPYAFVYDGVDQYIDFGDVNDLGADDFILWVWFKVADAGLSNYIFSKTQDGLYNWFLRVFADDLYFYAEANNVPNIYCQTDPNLISDDTWTMAALAVNRYSGCEYFLDGESVNTITNNFTIPPVNINNGGDFNIGIYNGTTDSFDGLIGDTGIITFDGIGGRADSIPSDYENIIKRIYNATEWKYDE